MAAGSSTEFAMRRTELTVHGDETAHERRDIMERSVDAIIPGLCARVVVSEGDRGVKGQEVAVINCMKTEYSVCSQFDATVKKVLSKEWDELDVGTPMVILEVDHRE